MRNPSIQLLTRCAASLLFLAFTASGPLELDTKDIYQAPFSLNQYRGRVVVLFFTNKKYVKQRPPKYSELSSSYAMNERLQSVVIFSSKGVPKIARRSFRKKLIARIKEQEQAFLMKVKQEGKDPAKVVFPRYLTDWKSHIHKMFDMNPKEKNFSIVILDSQGNMKGRFPGEDKYEDAVQLLERLLGQIPDSPPNFSHEGTQRDTKKKKTVKTILIKSFWESRTLFSKRVLAAGGTAGG